MKAGLFLCGLTLAALSALPAGADGPVPAPTTNATEPAPAPAPPPQLSELTWEAPAKGLELGVAGFQNNLAGELIIIRIDPALWTFSLYAASLAEGGAAKPLAAWAAENNLVAAVNAGMYLPDNLTHTGYFRLGEHLNNPRKGKRLGSFFVCGPKQKGLPQVDILETGAGKLENRLVQYNQVIQNFRLLDAKGQVLWPAGSPRTSIAAVGKDAKGRILFILCQALLSAQELGTVLADAPLDLGSTMYVEGGSKAALYLHEPNENSRERLWTGKQSLMGRGDQQPLPNILGIKVRGE